MTKLERVWKDKWVILRAWINTILKKPKIELIAQERQKICKKCPLYDSKGESDKVFIKGKPACGVCGCNIKFLTHSMESECSLKELGQEPLWKAKNI